MLVLVLTSSVSLFLLLFPLASLSVPGSFSPDTSVSLSKTKHLVIKRTGEHTICTQTEGLLACESRVLSSLGTTQYLPRITVKGGDQVQ